MLTVSDLPDFTGRGGMIGFVTEAGAVRLIINRVAMEGSHLRMPSGLQALTTGYPPRRVL